MGGHRHNVVVLGLCREVSKGTDEVACRCANRAKQSPGRTPRSGLVSVLVDQSAQFFRPSVRFGTPCVSPIRCHTSGRLHNYFFVLSLIQSELRDRKKKKRLARRRRPSTTKTRILPKNNLTMAAIGSLVFCTDCGNLLPSTKGTDRNVLKCESCGAENQGSPLCFATLNTSTV